MVGVDLLYSPVWWERGIALQSGGHPLKGGVHVLNQQLHQLALIAMQNVPLDGVVRKVSMGIIKERLINRRWGCRGASGGRLCAQQQPLCPNTLQCSSPRCGRLCR